MDEIMKTALQINFNMLLLSLLFKNICPWLTQQGRMLGFSE